MWHPSGNLHFRIAGFLCIGDKGGDSHADNTMSENMPNLHTALYELRKQEKSAQKKAFRNYYFGLNYNHIMYLQISK